MARKIITKAATSQLDEFLMRDSTTGAPKTGLLYSDITCKYVREGGSSESTVTMATMTLGTWASGGFIEFGSSGRFQFGIPNAALASGANSVKFTFAATGCITKEISYQLSAVDIQDAVRLGLTALPNAAAAASGGLVVIGTTANTFKSDSSAQVTAASVQGNVTGSVASVSGNVGGNVVGSVASVTAGVTVSTNNDKTGYTLTEAFPTNFSALAITVGGAVTAGTVSDKTGYALTAAYDLAKTATQAGDAMTLTSAYDAAKTAAKAGDAMALTTDERTATATAVWASATRTLTSFGTLINDIWAFSKATVAAMATTTIGRYLYDTVGSGGGSTTVNVLPVASTVSAGEVTGTSLIAYQNQTITYTFGIVDSNGDPVDLSTKAVAFYAALKGSQNTPIITRDSDGNGITIGGNDGNSVAVALTDTHTASIANYVYSLWNTTDDMPLAKGQLSIQAIPQEVA
jgi:hypothetical protein